MVMLANRARITSFLAGMPSASHRAAMSAPGVSMSRRARGSDAAVAAASAASIWSFSPASIRANEAAVTSPAMAARSKLAAPEQGSLGAGGQDGLIVAGGQLAVGVPAR